MYPYGYYPINQQRQMNRNRTIKVIGNGIVQVKPDIATIRLGVLTEDKSLSQAQEENAATMTRVAQSLQALGLPSENIQTTTFTVTPVYDFVEGRQVLRGYEVFNQITVIADHIEETGNVIDTAVRNGANRVSDIRFTVKEENIYYQQALTIALDNALEKAQTIAKHMNLPLDESPIKINEQMEAPIAFKTFAVAAGSATPIEPGQLTINAQVETILRY
ncbi:DUF541 domain-containing protein [Oceanobacillus piezotolerans]|uniref:DUF541 domain-containing protein n=1 Tax=Oceanobacillus piezotolerans TaxID=2448030 RepID=A0A498D9U2_9BACI|nr:SIMPL domain-containing protein [Oceanobacillus piezotolerans]RLL43700.1 DUF541 domain-containing protein [Oceanobacillus piezotolerans]